ncbi:MAG TPA: M56 family metallopeptidase [Bryobacteraceae bacterium]
MNVSYILRLVCLSLASFFLIHLAAGLLVSLVSPAAVRFSLRIGAGGAARFLLILRLFPAGAALLLVTGLCVPSYLWLEPAGATEDIGLWCLGAAVLAVAVWGISVARAGRAVVGSFRYIRHCQEVGRQAGGAIWVVESAAPVLGLAGIIRPRLVMSQGLVSALSEDQLAVVVRHERAHGVSRDNLKRLLILLAPDVFPFVRGFGALERGWAKFTEWSADDRAVAGNSRRSLSLAAALVRVARMSPAPEGSPLVASLLADGRDLSARVDRLLSMSIAPQRKGGRRMPLLAAGATVMLAVGLIAAALEPSTFHSVHELLEHLVR